MTFPFYAKFALVSIGIYAFVCVMYIGQEIILPVVYATIIAMLLNPLVNFMVRKRVNRLLAITLACFLAVLFTACLLYFISMQVSLFTETYPKFKDKFNEMTEQAILWVSQEFNLKVSKINSWINKTENEAINNIGGSMGGAIGQTISTINSVLIVVFLLPVYVFMILYYKPLLLDFLQKIFHKDGETTVEDILASSKTVIQSYLVGLLLEAAIVATLNSIGLLIIGIDYAIILAITGAIINVIPYLGGIISFALPMLMAFVTKDNSTYALAVFMWYLTIQFVDNHFIIPSIVASKVKLNALISVIAVFIGAGIWGVPGMFLSIPLTAIIKIICDNIDDLKPYGFLLGNIVPTSRLRFDFLKKKEKDKQIMEKGKLTK